MANLHLKQGHTSDNLQMWLKNYAQHDWVGKHSIIDLTLPNFWPQMSSITFFT